MFALASGALIMSVESNEASEETGMYTQYEIELTKQHREDVARQVENNRLTRQLRANRSGMTAETRNALLARVFAWFPRKGQAVEC